MKQKNKIGILVSGGLDSSILLANLCNVYSDIYPIYVKNGNFWENIELYWLKKFISSLPHKSLRKVTVLSLPVNDLYSQSWFITGKKVPGLHSKDEAVYLPGRNMLLIIKAAIFCAQNQVHEIALAHLKTNPFSDASSSFFNRFAKLFSQALDTTILIKTPFKSKTKREVMVSGKELRLDLTFSCLNPKKMHHCGRCNKCAERKKAFRTSGIVDLTHYDA